MLLAGAPGARGACYRRQGGEGLDQEWRDLHTAGTDWLTGYDVCFHSILAAVSFEFHVRPTRKRPSPSLCTSSGPVQVLRESVPS
jgi:hypothetical protein